jgi:hypothetical protein
MEIKTRPLSSKETGWLLHEEGQKDDHQDTTENSGNCYYLEKLFDSMIIHSIQRKRTVEELSSCFFILLQLAMLLNHSFVRHWYTVTYA